MTESIPADHMRVIRDTLANHFGYAGDCEVTRLGGLTNYNYRVIFGENDDVFRLPGAGTEGLVDRYVERDLTQAASDIGVDSKLLLFDPAIGLKVSEYVNNAETMHPETMRDPENIVLAAKLVRKLHDEAAPIDFRFDVFEMIPLYEDLIRQNETIDWEGYDDMRSSLFALRDRMASSGVVVCHCDPLCENFVKDPDAKRMYIVDWEYGGMNDPLWDVADVILEADLNRVQRDLFQESYFGRPATQEEDDLITVNIVLIDFLWALWGKQRCFYDHSLDSYGPERFERAKRNYAQLNLA